MRIFGTRRTRAVVVALAAGSLVLTACGGNDSGTKNDSKTQEDAAAQAEAVTYGDAKASTGPAAEVPGAKAAWDHDGLPGGRLLPPGPGPDLRQ